MAANEQIGYSISILPDVRGSLYIYSMYHQSVLLTIYWHRTSIIEFMKLNGYETREMEMVTFRCSKTHVKRAYNSLSDNDQR